MTYYINSEKKKNNISSDLMSNTVDQRRSPSVLLFQNKSKTKHKNFLSESVNAYKTTFFNNSTKGKKEDYTTQLSSVVSTEANPDHSNSVSLTAYAKEIASKNFEEKRNSSLTNDFDELYKYPLGKRSLAG
jgi:hypothetical protein